MPLSEPEQDGHIQWPAQWRGHYGVHRCHMRKHANRARLEFRDERRFEPQEALEP